MIVTEHLFAIEDQTECLISALLESDAVQNYKETKKKLCMLRRKLLSYKKHF